jgi:hypothetical protein
MAKADSFILLESCSKYKVGSDAVYILTSPIEKLSGFLL